MTTPSNARRRARRAALSTFGLVAALSFLQPAHATSPPDTPNSVVAELHPQATHNARVAEYLMNRRLADGHSSSVVGYFHR